MMQYIKILLLLSTVFTTINAGQQIEIRGGGVFDVDTSSTGSDSLKFNANRRLKYNGQINLGSSFKIEPDLTIIAIPGAKAGNGKYYQHSKYPFVFDGSVTSRAKNENNEVALSIEGDIMPQSKKILFPVVAADGSDFLGDSLRHSYATGVMGLYGFSVDHLLLEVNGLYRTTSYDHFYDSTKTLYREADLFYEGTGNLLFLDKQVYVGGNWFAKNDLNNYNGYNWAYSSVQAGTKVGFNKRKTQIYSRFAFTNLIGDMVNANGYTTGLGGECYIRVSQRVSRGVWMKGDIDLSLRTDILKSRFGGSVRRVNKISSVEGGYWTTSGSLFPRQCCWVNGSVSFFNKQLEFEPTLKNYWIRSDSSYRYYRTDIAMMLNILPIKESRILTLSTGGLWKNFKDATYFSSGIELFAGVATYL